MNEQLRQKRWRLWLVVGVGLLVAYPLSIGPIAHMKIHGGYHPTWLRLYCRPWGLIHSRVPEPLGRLMTNYLMLWVEW